MVVATRAAGDKEGDDKGGESDGDGDKEGDGEEEGEGPHSSSSSDRLPPRHMLPLLLRLATTFRAIVGAALRHSFGISSSPATLFIVVIALVAIAHFVARRPRRHRHRKADCCIIVIVGSQIDVVIIIAFLPS